MECNEIHKKKTLEATKQELLVSIINIADEKDYLQLNEKVKKSKVNQKTLYLWWGKQRDHGKAGEILGKQGEFSCVVREF